MINFIEINNVLDECVQHYRKLLAFENTKLQYIVLDDIEKLSACLKEEQALVMMGNSLEKKRIEVFSKNNIKDISLDELVNQCSTEYKTTFSRTAHEFKKLILEVKKINANSSEIVKHKLNNINNKLSRTTSDIYNIKGNKENTSVMPGSLQKNI